MSEPALRMLPSITFNATLTAAIHRCTITLPPDLVHKMRHWARGVRRKRAMRLRRLRGRR